MGYANLFPVIAPVPAVPPPGSDGLTMVDYVLRPLAGLLLCGLIGAVLLSLPWFVTRLREIVAELRATPGAESPPPRDEREDATIGRTSD